MSPHDTFEVMVKSFVGQDRWAKLQPETKRVIKQLSASQEKLKGLSVKVEERLP